MNKSWSHKKILLVYPEIPRATYWSMSKALEFIDKKSGMPPLGLLTVASMLPDSYELKLCDLNVGELSDDDIRWADYVFISSMIVQKDSMEGVIKRVNDIGVPIVVGGPYPSSFYNEIEGVDHFVIGEAEIVIDDFLKDFDRGEAKRAYARPVRQSEADDIRAHFGDDVDVELVENYVDIDRAPLPRFDLLNDYAPYQSMAVQTSRGCPIGCEFCDIWRRFGKKTRCKSFGNLDAELNSLYESGWNGPVFIVDDNFIGNRKRAKDLLDGMVKWQREHDYPFDFFTEVTLTLADDEVLLSLMRDAGFDFVFVGIESPSEASLAETGKHINNRGSMSEKVAKIQSYGIQVSSGFILGFDNDPEDIADRMVDCIQELGIPVAMVGLLQALPDTDLGERLAREGRMLSQSTGNNTHEFAINFKTKRPMERVIADYKYILQSIYPTNLKAYFARCSVLMSAFRHNTNLRQRTEFRYLKALVRFAWKSMFRAYRWNCWKFIITTVWKNPKSFSTACTLAVQGHHFREITRLAFEMDQFETKFSKRLNSVIVNLRKEMGTRYISGGDHLDKLAKLMDKRRRYVNKYARKHLLAMSRKYGLPIQKTYDEFVERLETAFHELQMEYGLLAPVPVKV